MRLSTRYTWITAIVVLILTASCVNDDSFFPNSISEEITSSTAVVSLLKNLFSGTNAINEDQQCFKFNYPIVLGYNNNANITIGDYSGLLSTISGQSSNFNITGLQFPIEVMFKNTNNSIRIEDEDALLGLLNECGYDSLREEFERLFRQCFTFDYPVVVLDSIKKEVSVATDQEFDTFFKNQNTNYQPEFKFPVDLLVGPNAILKKTNTYFDFYEAIDTCVGCPLIGIDSTKVSNTEYRFTANFDIKPEYELFWIVDQETFPFVNGENSITRRFDFGLHKVCVKALSPDCPLGIEVCKEIVICPQLFFIAEQEGNTTTYSFFADFPEIQDVTYKWLINGEFQENDGGSGGDNMFTFEFTPGSTNEVCMSTDISGCTDISKYCVQIDIP